MSASFAPATIVSMFERLLPRQVSPPESSPARTHAFYVGVGLPSNCSAKGQFNTLAQSLQDPAARPLVYQTLREQAVAGNIEALNDLGWLFLNGKYWRADHGLAHRLFRQAAQQGCAKAHYNLAQQYYFGKGLDISYSQVARSYEKAFELGLGDAAALLGDLYEEELCLEDHQQVDWQPDHDLAYDWYCRGADAGDIRCRFEIGTRMLNGVGMERDAEAGQYWLELAAAAGNAEAAEELAFFHSNDGLTPRYLFWRDQAVALGSGAALVMKASDQRRQLAEQDALDTAFSSGE